MRVPLPLLLSLVAGYVDTAGYLAFQGLFTAHVTGNFVTIGASLIFGTSGVVAKLIALPVFCIVVAAVRTFGVAISEKETARYHSLLFMELALLIVAAALAIALGPFRNGDTLAAIATGMTFVAAMAIQNALQRIHLGALPPTTLMTGNVTQIVVDFVDLRSSRLDDASRAASKTRLRRMTTNIVAFAIGCALGALLLSLTRMWSFALAPLIVLGAILAPAQRSV